MSVSDYLEGQIMNSVFKNTAGDLPKSAWYLKLHTGDPGEAGTSNAATETDRQAITWGTVTDGVVANSAALTWTSVAGTETYSHVSIWDHVSAGNCLWSGALDASKAVNAGDTFEIGIGDLTVTLA